MLGSAIDGAASAGRCDAGGGQPPAADGQPKRKRAQPADGPVALPGTVHPLGRQDADQPLHLVLGRCRASEIVPDRRDGLPNLRIERNRFAVGSG
jgi:hypothetical protein